VLPATSNKVRSIQGTKGSATITARDAGIEVKFPAPGKYRFVFHA